MKKRSVLVSFVLAFALMITACGQSNPFVGSWKGTCDFTDVVISSFVGSNASMEKYMKFDKLEFVMNFEFTETEISMSVDEASLETFCTRYEEGVANMLEAMLIDELEAGGMTYEEYIAESGMDRETLIHSYLEEMDLDSMIESMVGTLLEEFELSGTYTYDGKVLTITYEDNTYEEMAYVFDGKSLVITVSDGEVDFPIFCEKQ